MSDSNQPRSTGFDSALTTSCGRVHFRRAGQGRPLVFLHDLARDLGSFDLLAACLAADFQLIQVDLLGHGTSDHRPTDLSLDAQADAISELLADLDLGQAVLVGHSLGGSVALKVARQAPGRCSRLVLISSGVYGYELPLRWRFARTAPGWRVLGLVGGSGVVHRALRRYRVTPPHLVLQNDPLETPAGWVAVGRAWRQSTSEASLAELESLVDAPRSHPTLVLWGTENRLLPLGSARVCFQKRRNVRFVEVTGAAHAVHEEAPEVVADVIREFLT